MQFFRIYGGWKPVFFVRLFKFTAMSYLISGIQQMGIGVPDVQEIWKWYRLHFGMDIRMFEEAAEAPLMIDYTGNKVQSRTATLALSMQGGGGFEIWQYTSRNTEKPDFEIQLGDLGIFICRIKCKNVVSTFAKFKNEKLNIVGELQKDPDGKNHFFVKDPNGNIFDIVEGSGWFADTGHFCGGVAGAMLGVSDIEKSLTLYRDVLGYTKVEYDKTGKFDDLKSLPGGDKEVRRILLSAGNAGKGPFGKLLGPTKIELIQALNYSPKKIFKNRFWGDWGYIHLCFDIRNMQDLQKACEAKGFPFTVDSKNTFDMGEAGGHFSYIEDPDGTLIEFVETHKIPVIKKIGWYLNLKKRDPEKNLPNFVLKALKFNRVKG